ncbi:oxidoreductase [Paenibacillus oenotherae]|uniref:Oxidoreductase n=1 Tax=Paenibacillus oenotherae TaxID=1435645 RepID=A0ABS7D690_9BACL|nr:oxidoreductase [Paenibacillus oenotherae]MBW7475457.1 oxidoreductase [Paenibacillus oenotherae]
MTEQRKTALLAGASGLVGAQLLKDLLEKQQYSQVKVLVRNPLSLEHPRMEQIVVDFDELGSSLQHFQVDDVYCTLGTTIKKAGTQEAFKKVDLDYPLALAKLAKQGGAQRFLMVTALGANPRSGNFYSRVKGEVEESVRDIGLPALHIFRPSLLLGDRKEFRLVEKLAIILSPLFKLVMRGRLRRYRPVHAAIVARAMAVKGSTLQEGVFIYESDQIAEIGG